MKTCMHLKLLGFFVFLFIFLKCFLHFVRSELNKLFFTVTTVNHLQFMISSQRAQHVKSTSTRRQYYIDFSHIAKSTSFPRTFFDLISLVKISTFFPRSFFDAISMIKKSTLFSRTFFHVILMVEKFTLFARTFFDQI